LIILIPLIFDYLTGNSVFKGLWHATIQADCTIREFLTEQL